MKVSGPLTGIFKNQQVVAIGGDDAAEETVAVEQTVVDPVEVLRPDGPGAPGGLHDRGVAHEGVGLEEVVAHRGEEDVLGPLLEADASTIELVDVSDSGDVTMDITDSASISLVYGARSSLLIELATGNTNCNGL